MATSILQDALILNHGVNMTGQTNTVGIDFGAETQDNTTFSDDTRSNQGGLKTVGFNAEGFFDPAKDSQLFSEIGVQDKIISVAEGKANGDRTFSFLAVYGSYQPMGGSVGELNGYSLDASASNALERGQLLFYSTSETSSGTSTPLNAGSAASSLVGILHVWSVAGTNPTLDVDIESDSANDFTGAETTRLTFAQATASTAERKTGTATGDTWWRINFTIGGTNPDFAFAVVLFPTP